LYTFIGCILVQRFSQTLSVSELLKMGIFRMLILAKYPKLGSENGLLKIVSGSIHKIECTFGDFLRKLWEH
jgi:hypothetical protein